jgi:hypothetical protein
MTDFSSGDGDRLPYRTALTIRGSVTDWERLVRLRGHPEALAAKPA